jgi:hypothetical protein
MAERFCSYLPGTPVSPSFYRLFKFFFFLIITVRFGSAFLLLAALAALSLQLFYLAYYCFPN